MLIPEFFKNQVMFLTGGTGFLGKALIEKLLRSCPGIAKIYILIRAKKGKTPRERLDETLKDPGFRRLWKESPEAFEKLEAIEGDCRQLELGISSKDLERLSQVTIIIHSAATVRFDEPLREAVHMNTRGTHELLKIATNLKNLRAFVHISTTFSNSAESEIYEKVYEPTADWRNVLKFADNVDPTMLNILTAKIGNRHPNTYTFTKHLAEQIVFEYKDKLPINIFRPAIVVSAIREPCPGWIDNVNGPMGIIVAAGLGIKRSDFIRVSAVAAMVPIDIVVRGIIISCFKMGTRSASNKEMDIYNCAINENSLLPLKELTQVGVRALNNCPFEKSTWAPGATLHESQFTYLLQVVLQEVPFSMLLDVLLRLKGKKPKLVKLQRIIANTSKALKPFMFTTWELKRDNFLGLENFVAIEDKTDFTFLADCGLDFEKYIFDGIYGIREFILKEPRNPTPNTIVRMKIVGFAHKAIKVVSAFFILQFLLKKTVLYIMKEAMYFYLQ